MPVPGVPNWPSDWWTNYIPCPAPMENSGMHIQNQGYSKDLNTERLMLAIGRGHGAQLQQLLIYQKISIYDIPTEAVRQAMSSPNPSIIKVVLEFGINLNGLLNQLLYLHRAAHKGDIQTIQLLLYHGADGEKTSGFFLLFPQKVSFLQQASDSMD